MFDGRNDESVTSDDRCETGVYHHIEMSGNTGAFRDIFPNEFDAVINGSGIDGQMDFFT